MGRTSVRHGDVLEHGILARVGAYILGISVVKGHCTQWPVWVVFEHSLLKLRVTIVENVIWRSK